MGTLRVQDFLADQTILRAATAPAAPRVSVILPTYRRGRDGRLLRAIESVLQQSFEDLELVVVDDGSVDGSAELIEGFRMKDPRVVHVRHETNCGLWALRVDEGIELSRGRYLAFQFDDDAWRPRALEALTDAVARARTLGVVVGRTQLSAPTWSRELPTVELNLVTLYEQNRLANNSVLVARDLVERFGMYDCHLAMRRLADWDLWLRYAREVPFLLVDELIAHVHVSTPGSMGTTVPFDLSLFRYLHGIPRSRLLMPSTWREYEVDALRIGEVELTREFRRRVWEDHVLPYYLRYRTVFPGIEGFRTARPSRRRVVLYATGAYETSDEGILTHLDAIASRRGSYKSYFRPVGQVHPGWERECDALLLARVGPEQGKALAADAQRAGIPLAVLLDDGGMISRGSGSPNGFAGPASRGTLGEPWSQADVVWTRGLDLAEPVSVHNPRVVPYGVGIPDDWLPREIRSRRPSDPVRIGYIGSEARREELALIRDALQRVSRKLGDRLVFEFWGVDGDDLPPLDSPATAVPVAPDAREYPRVLKDARVDLLLCPLPNHPAPGGDTGPVRYAEAAIAGALGIFSDVPSCASLPGGVTCLKTANDPEAWSAALEAATALPADEFDRMRRRGLAHVREEFTTPALIDRYEAAWRATEFHARTCGRRHFDGRPRVVYLRNIAHVAGAEVQLWRRLRLVRRYGIEPVVVLPATVTGSPEAEEIARTLAAEGIPLEFLDYTFFDEPRPRAEPGSPVELASVRRLLARVDPALVHSVKFVPSVAAVCREMGIPHVATLYALDDAFEWRDADPGPPHCALIHCDSVRYARRWADLLGTEWFCARGIVPEEFFRLGLEQSWRVGGERRQPSARAPLRLIMAGTLQPRKGQAEAIEAVGRLCRDGIDCRLDLYGYVHFLPAYHERCLELIRTLGIEDRVALHGFRTDLVTVLRDADVLLCASTFESLPSAIKEAMAAGVLVVATPVGGVPELIVDGVTGILAEGSDSEAIAAAVRRALSLDEEARRRLVEAARRVARIEVHPHRAANDLLSMYVRALERTQAAEAELARLVPKLEESRRELVASRTEGERVAQDLAAFREKGRRLALEVEAFRRRRAIRWLDRVRGRGDLTRQLHPAFRRLTDDSVRFTPDLRGFRLEPSDDLRSTPFVAYPLRPGRRGLREVLLAPILELPLEEGVLGIEIVSPEGAIVVQRILPAAQIDERSPTGFAFPPIADSDRGGFWLRVFAWNAPDPVRVLEWRRYRWGGLGRRETRGFCGLSFEEPAPPGDA